MGAFPRTWEDLVLNNIESNSSVDVRENIIIEKDSTTAMVLCTVKKLRKRLVRIEQFTPKFETVLGISPHDGINPFTLARTVNHAISQKIFKFRLLHLDIFTKQRMFKFKMTNDDLCEFCKEIETLKHAIWDCPRARVVWCNLRIMMTFLNIHSNINFETLFIGLNPTIPIIDTLITRLTQLLLSSDRSGQITDVITKNCIHNYALVHKYKVTKKQSCTESIMWEKIISWSKN